MSHNLKRELIESLRKLKQGDRVHYRGWRGEADRGQGVFWYFINSDWKVIPPEQWGRTAKDGLIVKRDFSADDGRRFLPLLGDGDAILTDEMLAAEVHDS